MTAGADVIVVGGGIAGSCVARELARRGAEVLLFERASIASGASGRNHGLLMYPQSSVLAPLYAASRDIYREVVSSAQFEVRFDTKSRGFLIVVESEEGWEAAEREARASAEGGVAVERLDSAALKDAEPNLAPHHLGGWWIDDAFIIDPAALTLAACRDAAQAGAEIRSHMEVAAVTVRNGRATGVATDEGIFEARVVVDAAGPWASKVARSAGVEIEVRGVRGWLLSTASAPTLVHHVIESAGWHLTAGDHGPITLEQYGRKGHRPPETGLLIQQNPGGNLLLGGSRQVALADDAVEDEVSREIARRAARAVPALGEVAVASIWSGIRPMSPDGVPLIGWAGDVEGFFVASGYGSQGVILGGGAGRLAADLITGEKPYCDPAGFDPARLTRP